MKTIRLIIPLIFVGCFIISALNGQENMNYNTLTPEEEYVIVHKGTERPFSGEYNDTREPGTYVCRRCDAALYRSSDKFDSNCGWPSFDVEIDGAVRREIDADGQRTEILCNNCGGHLGHVFEGEGYTSKNIRHCVNSISMKFIPAKETQMEETAIFASGCFWGTEYHFNRKDGIIGTTVGYTGGHKENPTYKEVCTGTTGHAEAVKVTYNPSQVTYEELTKLFFETHDQGQEDGQGPDIGHQYRSVIFYNNEQQKKTAEKLIAVLESKGYKVATDLEQAGQFWEAEDYHQDYYENNGKTPYCHFYTKKF